LTKNEKNKKKSLEKIKPLIENNGYKSITIITQKGEIDIKYRTFFLEARGHNLAKCLHGNTTTTTDKILNNINSKDLEAIPLDLAIVFFDLNTKVINIVRLIIGKGELVRTNTQNNQIVIDCY
jgi:hypothetical protein